jgi:hypothetical protein
VHISVYTFVLHLQTCSLISTPSVLLKAPLFAHLLSVLRLHIAVVLHLHMLSLQVELYLVIMALFVAICRLLYNLLGEPGALLLQVLEVRSQRCIVL